MGELRFIQAVCGNVVKGNWPVLSTDRISNLLTPYTVTQILRHLSPNIWFSWSFYNWANPLSNYRHSVEPNWTMVHLLTEDREFSMATELLEKFAVNTLRSRSSPFLPDDLLNKYPSTNGHVLNRLMTFYAKSKLARDAVVVFNRIKSNGLKPDLYSCSALLSALAKEKSIATAWKVFDEMVKLEIVPNIHLYNSLLYICSRSNNLDKANEIISEMEKNGVELNIVSYNNLVNLLGNKGMSEQAWDLVSKMKEKGVNLDIITYNSLINAFIKEGKIKKAVNIFKKIYEGMSPNKFTYETLIKGYCLANDPETAIKMLNEMEEKQFIADSSVFNKIINKLCYLGKTERAHEVLDEIPKRKIKPDNLMFLPLINGYMQTGDLDNVSKLKNTMIESGLKLDICIYKELIEGFSKGGKLDEAKQTFLELIRAGFYAKYTTVYLFVDSFCSQNKAEEILEVSKFISKKDEQRLNALYTALIQSLCKRELNEDVHKVLDEMLARGYCGNLAYIIMALTYHKEGKLEKALEALDSMVAKKLNVAKKSYKFVVSEFPDDFVVFKKVLISAREKGLIPRNIRRYMRCHGLRSFKE